MQHWTRLQEENAIPLHLINEVLHNVVVHLRDKGAIVRKNAARCLTTFLTHNPYSSQVSSTYNLSHKSIEKSVILVFHSSKLRSCGENIQIFSWSTIKINSI